MVQNVAHPYFCRSETTPPSLREVRLQTDLILSRTKWLSRPKRVLLEAVLRDGHSPMHLARLTRPNCESPRQSARSLRWEVRRLCKHVLSTRVEYIVNHCADWCPTRQKIALMCLVEGRSQRNAAGALRLSLHEVRREYNAVVDLFRAEITAAASALGEPALEIAAQPEPAASPDPTSE